MTFKQLYAKLVAQAQRNHPKNETIQDRNVEYDTSHLCVTEVFESLEDIEPFNGFSWGDVVLYDAEVLCKQDWNNYILDCLGEY